jgi:oligopeptidase B
MLAYGTDLLSRRVYTVFIKDLKTGELLKDKLEETTGRVIWANDNKTVFYIKKDMQTLLGNKVYRHVLGTDQSEDVLVYEEKDVTFYMGLGKSRDDSTLMIWHDSTIKAGVSILEANNPTGAFKLFHALEDNHEYSISKAGDDFYIRTNWNATNFRLMKVSADKTADKKAWKDVIPHRENTYFENYKVFNDNLVVSEKTRGQTNIRVINLKSGKDFNLKFNDPVFSARISSNPDMTSDKVRISYTSMTTPRSLYDFDMTNGNATLLKQTEVLGDFNPDHYASERIFIKARDGKEVPVTIAYRKNLFKKDGTNPIYQYAYGSYGSTMNPSFSSSRLSLLDRGVVYVLAHIRGGQMLGRPWYEDGKLYNKMNSFTDFMDVTKALTAQKYGAKDTVFAAGGSAGGLLIGGVINMEPELYMGVLAAVPFVDVVTTMLDASIPLTTNEYDEWGNPNEKGYYEYMKKYSPYDNVKAINYPHIYVSSGLHDSQVQYFEPAKWVAKLRELKTDQNKLVFDIDMEAGHGGASGRFKAYRDTAREYAFYFDLLGIDK